MALSSPTYSMPHIGGGTKIVTGDFNGDGKKDFFVINYDWPTGAKPSTYALLLGASGGNVTLSQNVTTSSYSFPGHPMVGDFNKDGIDDIFIGTYGNELAQTGAEDFLMLGAPDGKLIETRPFKSIKTWAHGSTLGDLNNDGYLDVLNGGIGPLPSSVWLNNKNGSFELSTTALPQNAYPHFQSAHVWSTKIADLNGDGLNDIIVGHSGGAHALQPYGWSTTGAEAMVFYANAAGGWTTAQLPTGLFGSLNTDTVSIAHGDFDGDGRVDVLLSNYDKGAFLENGQVVYTGDANAGSSAGSMTVGGYTVTKAGMDNRELQLLLNKTTGWVDASANILSGAAPTLQYVSQVRAVDVDGDGDLDIVGSVAGQLTASNIGPFIWTNNGKGAFSALDTKGFAASLANKVWEWTYVDATGLGDWRMASSFSPDEVFPLHKIHLSDPLLPKVGIGGTSDADWFSAIGEVHMPLFAHGGDDVIQLTHFHARAELGAGNDQMIAGAGDAQITPGEGSDTVDGGAGRDTVIFAGNHSAYLIKSETIGFSISSTAGADRDIVFNVERLMFSDIAWALDIHGNGGQAYRIYKAAFARTPDSGGLGYWIKALDGGLSLQAIAEGFVDSKEFKELYGDSPTKQQIVEKFYQNVLGRAGEKAGIDFWVGVLESGAVSVSEVLMGFSESSENQDGLISVIANGFPFQPYGG